ncbi:uncharacterized protein LOC122261793 [Penaeus japonicus]|uniref:uncharacterized protein LOC122261793 n=1 Tax=Penaeus japonicus TaxID=27405 RepID=UPI001C70CD04|nr:uncharacterized protein LOC122261793 [Penaeus japonicus]
MKPFPGRDLTNEKSIYNYRVSRARRTSENAFGILAARFQIFKRPICTTPNNVKDIVFAAAVLHNHLRSHSKKTYSPPELLDREDLQKGQLSLGEWHQAPQGGLERLPVVGRGHSNNARTVRETLLSYFNNEGKVSWQDEMALLH